MQTKCAKCQKDIIVPRWRMNRYVKRSPNKNFYCSRDCYLTGRKWYSGVEHPRWKGGLDKRICKNCGNEFLAKPTLDTKFCSSKCWGVWYKKLFPIKRKKIRNPLKSRKEYKEWRKDVIKKYKKCVLCGEKENLIAHHLISVKEDETKIYEIENGIAVCINCHFRIHYSK